MAGFTLVEMLVVAAIIALLIGILVPAIGKARSAAESAVCSSNLRQVAAGFNRYATEFNDHLPGPNTSGAAWVDQSETIHIPGEGAVPAGEVQDLREAGRFDRTFPLLADDWYSPLFGDALGLAEDEPGASTPTGQPDAWVRRMAQVFEHEFRCPANARRYDGLYPDDSSLTGAFASLPGGVSGLRLNSYAVPMALHMYQRKSDAAAGHRTSDDNIRAAAYLAWPNIMAIDAGASGHRFRLSTVGPPSVKAAAYDGARYMRDGRVTFSVDPATSWGGNFMNRSPALNAEFQATGNPYKRDPDTGELRDMPRRVTYRHGGETINVSFLDGHVEPLDNESSRKLKYYVPSGTRIRSQVETIMEAGWSEGDTVP